MKHLSWIITLPLLALGVTFAVNNRQRIAIDLWPLEATLTLPVFLIVLLAIFIGFVLGGFVSWAAGAKRRRVASQRRWRVEELEREVNRLNRKLARQEEAARQEAAAREEAAAAQTAAAQSSGARPAAGLIAQGRS